jgi:hypothetical protein
MIMESSQLYTADNCFPSFAFHHKISNRSLMFKHISILDNDLLRNIQNQIKIIP